jgi:hypothetical protein
MTGLAAHLDDAVWHEVAEIQIAQTREISFGRMIEGLQVFGPISAFRHLCLGDEAGAMAQAPQPAEFDVERCPERIKPFKVAVKISFVTVSAACETFQIEGATPGVLGAFAEITFQSDGSVTLFAGPKAGGMTPVGPFGVTAKDGLYIKFSTAGVRDFGFRVNFTSSVGSSTHQIKGDAGSMDFSFVGVSDYLPGF